MGDNVEGPAKKDLDKLLARRSSTLPAFRSRLSYFLALQYIRGAATREARVDYFKSLFKMVALFATPEIIQAELLRQGEEVSLDDAEEILAVGQAPTTTVGLQPIGPQQLPADSLLHAPNLFKEAEQLKLYFYRRGWIVMQFANPCLLTSDEPVAIASADAPGQADGVGTAQTLVFPLDPRHALVMVHPEQQAEIHAWQLGTPEQARIINLHVAFKAHRHIIFHPDTDPLDGLVIPKKAPPTYRVGNYLMTSPHQSIETRRRMLEQIERSAR